MPGLQAEDFKREEPRREVLIRAGAVELEGELTLPRQSRALVVFAHGSGSSRRSPRNQFVASVLQRSELATLLLDLLTPQEDVTPDNRFDIDLLTERLMKTVYWTRISPELKNLPVGLFGASTGAASALQTAAHLGESVGAVVSRGGRPDLAGNLLSKVRSPALFIVGSNDTPIIPLNERAYTALGTGKKRLVFVSNAGHLFEEPGALEEVSRISSDWFQEHLFSSAEAL